MRDEQRRNLPPDPEEMNDKRAVAVDKVLDCFCDLRFGEAAWDGISAAERTQLHEQNLSDLLADMGHFCDRHGLQMQDVLRRAVNHYNEETGHKGYQYVGVTALPLHLEV